jgi:hypothetical protein
MKYRRKNRQTGILDTFRREKLNWTSGSCELEKYNYIF